MERVELVNKLNLLKTSLAKQDIVPVLSHFCFRDDKIYAFDGIQASVLDFKTDLSCALPGDLFLKFLNSFSSKKVTIQPKGSHVVVKSGGSRFKMVSLSEDDFIFELPEEIKGRMLSITEDLVTGIEKCLISANDNPIVSIPCGIIFKGTKNGLYLYSSNDICISRYELKDKYPNQDDFISYIPTSFCEQLIKWYKEFKGGEIFLGEDEITAEFEDGYLYTKLDVENDIVDFESMIFKCLKSKFESVGIPENLINCLDRSLLLLNSSELDQSIDVIIEESCIELLTNSSSGKINDEVDLDTDIGDFKFKIDPKYIIKALPYIDEIGFVEMLFDGSGSTGSTTLFVGQQDRFVHLIQSVG